MPSYPHTLFMRARRRSMAAAAGIILASAGVACASTASEAQTAGARPTPPSALRVGATSRAFVARMNELKAQGYVQTACTFTGAVMFNPYNHRTEVVPAKTAPTVGLPGSELAALDARH